MVKGVVGEESRLQATENRLSASGKAAEIGVVIGKVSRELDRGFVYELIPTPPNDAGEDPCTVNNNNTSSSTKGNKSKSSSSTTTSLSIDQEWVSEHGRQVSRMMVGGMNVIGIYVWAPELAFKNSTLLLSQAIKGVADAAPNSSSNERLVIHISYSPTRWTCRTSNLTSSTNLHPCDFKFSRIFNSLRAFSCFYHFNFRLPLCTESLSGTTTLNHVLRDVISSHAKELIAANALIDGHLVTPSEDALSTSEGLHEIELLFPFLKDGSMEASSRKEVAAILQFSGTVCSYAYLNAKEPVSQALADIKEDIIMSLKGRLDIVSDEAERELTAATGDGPETNSEVSRYQIILKPLKKELILPFPRRVFIPWLSGSFVCDYLLPNENFEALRDHFVELLSMEAPNDASFLELEKESPSLTTTSFWQVVAPLNRASGSALISSKSKTANIDAKNMSAGHLNVVFAGFIVLLAIILGALFYSRSASEL